MEAVVYSCVLGHHLGIFILRCTLMPENNEATAVLYAEAALLAPSDD